MVSRQIDLDEETARQLEQLATDYRGNVGEALADLLHAREALESMVEAWEKDSRDALLAQKERAETGFREGRFTSWDDVKRRNGL